MKARAIKPSPGTNAPAANSRRRCVLAPGFIATFAITLLALGGAARAEEPAAPTTPATTPTAAPAPTPTPPAPPPPKDLRPEVRIQRRLVEKKGRFAVYAGFAYLGRGDFYRSPGVEVALSYYLFEFLALDLRASWFFSFPSEELRELTARTGFIPDTRPSQASILVGARYSLGYAKLRVSSKLTLHFEPQVFLYGGVHVTSGVYSRTAAAPMFELGIGFLIYATKHLQARLDAGMTVGGEQRSSYVAVVGGFPVLAVGVMF